MEGVAVVIELSEEHEIFRRTVREFCEREARPLVEEAEAQRRFPREKLLPAMAGPGFFRIRVAPEDGGAGGDALMQCLFAEELARVCGGFAVSVLPSVVGPELLIRLASEEQREQWLEPLMSGRALAAIALTEPDAGSDVMGIRTVARNEGEHWVLDGTKTFITNGPSADLFLVAAVLAEMADRHGMERAAGLSLFLVPGDAAGLQRARRLDKLGMHSSETGELVFDGCRVPASSRLGGQKANLLALMKVLDHSRMYVASISLGLAQAAFDASCAYAKARKTFGKPIGQHQAIAFKLARMATDIDAARLLVQRAADPPRAGQALHEGGLDGEAVRHRDRGARHERGGADPRRLRLHDRAAGRALFPRRQGGHDLGGDLGDPAPPHRARARLRVVRFRPRIGATVDSLVGCALRGGQC